MKKIKKTLKIGGRELILSTGHIAEQASGAVMAQYGDTVVLATVVASPLEEDRGYFPLTVEYRERLSAGGRIKGSRWVKRPGRPSDDEILTARLIDRSIRPLFPEGYKKDVQVIASVLSIDGENSPDMVAAVAVSAAIEVSEIPWKGPVAVSRVGLRNDSFSINPIESEIEESEMDLIVSTIKDAIVMIESGASEVSEAEIVDGVSYAKKEGDKLNNFIINFAQEVGVTKESYKEKKLDAKLVKEVEKLAKKDIEKLISNLATKKVGYDAISEAKDAVKEELGEEKNKDAGKVFDEILKKKVRKIILSGKRPDGRKHDELRELSAETDVLPRTHGSGMFRRGQTQALTVATLGATSLEQLIETPEGEETKRYIHHYSMPPYSVGETGRVGYPSRREIGHGALAERALLPVIPTEDEFPYTIHLLTEILSSNGSTSMASVCGSSLALMDAGIPIKAAVAGIAMGLLIENEKDFSILTDIVGMEDGNGDMDFKVAGTKDGITALQLDVKTLNLSVSILEKALEQAKQARIKILEVMNGAISKPRTKLSEHAPKIQVVTVPKEKIGEVIGPGGKTIRKIMAETNTQVDVDDDGNVSIVGVVDKEVEKAVEWVESLVKVPEPGEIYEGEVKRVESYGAFVQILPGKEGLVHVSDMSEDFVKNPTDLVSLGDKVQVRVKEIDNLGRLNLSMILDPSKERNNSGGNKGGRNRRKDSRRHKGKKRSSGPHFPATRLMDKDKQRN